MDHNSLATTLVLGLAWLQAMGGTAIFMTAPATAKREEKARLCASDFRADLRKPITEHTPEPPHQ